MSLPRSQRNAPPRRAFTLIELLIVVAILAFFTSAFSAIFIRIVQEWSKSNYLMEARSDSHLALEALARDFSRQGFVLEAHPPSEEDERHLLTLRSDGGRDGADAWRVDYFLRGRKLVREQSSRENGSGGGQESTLSQVLARGVESLVVVRGGRLLHVDLSCARKPGKKRYASRVRTDFFIEDWTP